MRLIKQMFTELHTGGASYRAIAKELRVNPRTLLRWRKELGLPGRRRGLGSPSCVKAREQQ